jgi:glucuronoarabinoxylan endo-1,4-beta-xylanase
MKSSKTTLPVFLLLLSCASHCQAQTATINWNNTHQILDGFGASDAFELAPLTRTQADLFFSPTTGIGLSLLRTNVPEDGSCSTVNTTCAGDVSNMQIAIANGAKVWSTPWSPPASMKSNGSIKQGGALLPGSYAAYATYLANYVKSLKSLYGIDLYALSVQNEPESAQHWDSAVWTPANFATFIGANLGPTFAADGLATLIITPETFQWQDLAEYENPTMSNSKTATYVSIIATHNYAYNGTGEPPSSLGHSENKHLWETEICDFATPDPSIASALKYAQSINNWMTISNANAWHYWELINPSVHYNAGLMDSSGTATKRLYMMGNYSKFVRPGFYRIDATATPQNGVSVSAYKNSTSSTLVIVVINQNSSNVSQTFALNGAAVSSVTPWITSASFDLVQQSDVPVSGGSFVYSLPAASITSFVGTTALAAPTGLTAKVL